MWIFTKKLHLAGKTAPFTLWRACVLVSTAYKQQFLAKFVIVDACGKATASLPFLWKVLCKYFGCFAAFCAAALRKISKDAQQNIFFHPSFHRQNSSFPQKICRNVEKWAGLSAKP